MTPAAIGRSIRALRHRRGWRQADLALKVEIGQSAISGVESGDLGTVSARTLQRIAEALGAELVIALRWQGGDLDRLTDRAHADLVERTARRLASRGWVTYPEVSFNRYGEGARSTSLLGIPPPASRSSSRSRARSRPWRRRSAATTRRRALAPAIVFERLGERPVAVGRLLVAPDTSTTRRQIAEHGETLARAYPLRGRAVSRWLAHPRDAMAGVLLLPPGVTRARRRVRVPRAADEGLRP